MRDVALTTARRAVLLKVAGPVAVALMVLMGLLVLFGPAAMEQSSACAPQVGAPQVITADHTTPDGVRAEQLQIAAAIDDIARQRGLPGAAVRVALVAGLTESSLLNLDHGHADSVGIFQMRPSQGWGTLEQLQDVEYQVQAFFGGTQPPAPKGLVDHPGWPELTPGEAAQAVEASAYPERYAQHLSEAEALAAEAGIDLTRPGDPYAGADTSSTTPTPGTTTGMTGTIGVAQANIPDRSGIRGFNQSMPLVLATGPDFVSLNEQAHRTVEQITAAAPGYAAYKDPTATGQAASTAVLWLAERWTKTDAGRVELVPTGPQRWDAGRSATWVTVQDASGAVVSMISVHHMVNPAKFGPDRPARQRIYGEAMDRLLALVDQLEQLGPVFVAGDMNTHANQQPEPWSAAAKMAGAGYGWADHYVDFLFYNQQAGITVANTWSGPMVSDHDWLAAAFNMNGVGVDTVVFTGCVGTDLIIPAGQVTGPLPPEACSVVPDPSTGRGCLTPRTNTVLQAVQAQPHTGVSCWDEHAWNPTSDHPRGRACDVFFGPGGQLPTAAGKAQGDAIAQFFIDHAAEYGINYLIWSGRMWRSSTATWSPYSGGGVYDPADITGGHYDHVHLSVL